MTDLEKYDRAALKVEGIFKRHGYSEDAIREVITAYWHRVIAKEIYGEKFNPTVPAIHRVATAMFFDFHPELL